MAPGGTVRHHPPCVARTRTKAFHTDAVLRKRRGEFWLICSVTRMVMMC